MSLRPKPKHWDYEESESDMYRQRITPCETSIPRRIGLGMSILVKISKRLCDTHGSFDRSIAERFLTMGARAAVERFLVDSSRCWSVSGQVPERLRGPPLFAGKDFTRDPRLSLE